MALSKQHTIYAGILAVAVVGLVADRALFQPTEAAADLMDEYAVNAADTSDTTSNDDHAFSNETIASRTSVGRRLSEAAGQHSIDISQAVAINNIFAPSSSAWGIESAADNNDAGRIESDPSQAKIAQFKSEHRLTAVMGGGPSGTQGYAIVDGRPIRVGQVVDGWTLMSVSERSAVFASGESQLELAVDAAGLRASDESR